MLFAVHGINAFLPFLMNIIVPYTLLLHIHAATTRSMLCQSQFQSSGHYADCLLSLKLRNVLTQVNRYLIPIIPPLIR